MPYHDFHEIITTYGSEIYGIIDYPDFSSADMILADKESKGLSSTYEHSLLLRNDTGYKSVITMAFPYRTSFEIKTGQCYDVSQYACIDDYHVFVRNRLMGLCDKLKMLYPDNTFTPVTDSFPLYEKESALMAGIGFYGKNFLIYTEKYGSYVFLGEILSDLTLPTRIHSTKNTCNNCGLCVRMCPAQAIGDKYLESKKCISYLTQSKDEIEAGITGTNLWGCDICQSVCPLNKKAFISPHENITERSELFIAPEKLLLMSGKKLKEFYKNTAIGWSGVFPLKRNLITAIGTSGNKNYLPLLKNLLQAEGFNKYEKYIMHSINQLEK